MYLLFLKNKSLQDNTSPVPPVWIYFSDGALDRWTIHDPLLQAFFLTTFVTSLYSLYSTSSTTQTSKALGQSIPSPPQGQVPRHGQTHGPGQALYSQGSDPTGPWSTQPRGPQWEPSPQTRSL